MQTNHREKRQHGENKADDPREAFQIDRDRLIYSAYFRRLAQVTQVASASEGSVFHNRLTHSLKVAQIARRLAEQLIQKSERELINSCGGLDPDVVEAAALAHDLGHPPFGHIAEKELDKLAKQGNLKDGFEGNAQTFRILTLLEANRPEYPGLDLTRATLNATLKYPWFRNTESQNAANDKKAKKFSAYGLDREAFKFVREPLEGKTSNEQQTLEASVMEFADDVTYSVHDLEDFYLAGLIPLDTLVNDDDEFESFISEWRDDRLKELINTSEQKKKFKRILQWYVRGYSHGSFEQLANIRRVSSILIQEYVQSVELQEEYGNNGYLKRQEVKEAELKFLQRVVWKYVIDSPRLATQQYGQRRIIKTLFEVYRDALEENKLNLIPARFLKNKFLDKLLETENKKEQQVRIAVDIVSSFSEMEAIVMYRRFSGIEQGSVMDYIV